MTASAREVIGREDIGRGGSEVKPTVVPSHNWRHQSEKHLARRSPSSPPPREYPPPINLASEAAHGLLIR